MSAADDYADYWDPGIAEHYDIVFADQRGTGLSHQITCPAATSTYYGTDADPKDPADAAAVRAAASTYVKDCMTESKADPADLPFYATSQAIDDLEAFRQYLDADKLELYGESYGTQFVQTYAAKYPEHIASLFIDGPVDLVPDGITYYTEAARAWDDVLVSTTAACQADAACKLDTQGGDPMAAYDALIKKLEAGPIMVRFPLADGTVTDRPLAKTDIETTAVSYGYGPFGRSQFLRALTAASKGDYVPMLRAYYDSIVVDPETLKTIPDPTYSDAMYYSTECQDYAFFLGQGDGDARANAWLAEGAKTGINDLRLGGTYYGDMPCVYWPAQPKTDPRPKAILDAPYPTFVMTATSDPATPIANAMRLYGRLNDAYFIEALGGDHVIFGRGDDCPDKMITAYLVSGTLPSTRVTTCPAHLRRRVRRECAAAGGGLPRRARADGLDGGPDHEHRRLQLPPRRGPDHDGLLPRRDAQVRAGRRRHEAQPQQVRIHPRRADDRDRHHQRRRGHVPARRPAGTGQSSALPRQRRRGDVRQGTYRGKRVDLKR